jgi:RNA polymerase sigma factor (TIGR02999 family)
MNHLHDDLERITEEWSDGDPAAFNRLIDLLYDDLRRIASRHLDDEREDHTLSTTALVHEAYLEIASRTRPEWRGRPQFLALLSRVMRHVLVDHARTRRAAKRGGDHVRIPLDQRIAARGNEIVEILAMDDALKRLAERHSRMAQVVECRFFGGLSDEEIAATLGVSERTVNRDWARARAYLVQMLGGGDRSN